MRCKKYALIWWLNSRYKDVVELSAFSVKYRHVNAVSNLLWMNHETGVQTKAQAKILAISEDKTELDLMWVSSEGEILDHGRRIFSKEAIDKKSSCDQENKLKKKIIKANKRKMENDLTNQSSIFRLTPKRRVDTEISANFLAHQKPTYLEYQPSTSGSSTSQFQRPIVGHEYRNSSLSSAFESNFENGKMTKSKTYRASSHADVPLVSEIGCTSKNVHADVHNSSTSGSSTSQFQRPIVGNEYRNSSLSSSFESNFENGKMTKSKTYRASSHSDVPLVSEVGYTSKNVHADVHNSSSDEDDFNNDNWSGALNAMAFTFPGKVTARDIAFQTFLLKAMKQAYKLAHPEETDNETFELPSCYLKPAPGMQEIVNNCGFFLPKNAMTYIYTVTQTDAGVEDKDKWKILVRETLLEVYGHTINTINTIANYSARGKRGKKPSINPLLLKGLFQWACYVSPDLIYKDFIKFINKFACNKRRYQDSKRKNNNLDDLNLKKKNSSSHFETRHDDQRDTFDSSKSTALNLESDGTHLSIYDQKNTFYLSRSSMPLNVEIERKMDDGNHLLSMNYSQIEMIRDQQHYFNSNRATLSNPETTKSTNDTIDWAKSLQPI